MKNTGLVLATAAFLLTSCTPKAYSCASVEPDPEDPHAALCLPEDVPSNVPVNIQQWLYRDYRDDLVVRDALHESEFLRFASSDDRISILFPKGVSTFFDFTINENLLNDFANQFFDIVAENRGVEASTLPNALTVLYDHCDIQAAIASGNSMHCGAFHASTEGFSMAKIDMFATLGSDLNEILSEYKLNINNPNHREEISDILSYRLLEVFIHEYFHEFDSSEVTSRESEDLALLLSGINPFQITLPSGETLEANFSGATYGERFLLFYNQNRSLYAQTCTGEVK